MNGEYIKVDAYFRKYKSWEESVKDHGEFFRSTPTRVQLYKPVYTAKSWEVAVNALTGTYATSPTYAQTLTKRIQEYGLDKYDPTLDPVPEYTPYHIGVYAKSTTDLGGALRIIAQVKGAVLVDASRVDPTYYKEIIQVGGPKDDKATIHLSGENRKETDRAVTAWLEEA